MNKRLFSLFLLSLSSFALISFGSSQAMKRKAETDIITQTTSTDQTTIQEAPWLPDELIAKIAGSFRPYDKNMLMQVNKDFHKAIGNRELMLRTNPEAITEEDITKSLCMYAADTNKIDTFKIWLDQAKAVGAKYFHYKTRTIDHRNILDMTPFHIASNANNTKAMELLINYGADVTPKSPKLHPLQMAAYTNNITIATMLLDGKVDPNILLKNPYSEDANQKRSPLLIAIACGNTDMVELLIYAGADLNITADIGNWSDLNPIQWAAVCGYPEIIKILIRAGVNLSEDACCLHHASSQGWKEIAELVLDAGADIDKESHYNDTTPLNLAIEGNQLDMVKFLVARNANMEGALYTACDCNNFKIAEFLLDNGAGANDDGILHNAARIGNLDLIRLLLNHEAEVNKKDYSEATPLHHASGNGHLNVVKELLNRGAKVNEQDQRNKTPLDYASEHGFIDIVKELLSL